jgi:DNA-binding IclR family transcriptional regulator
MSHTISRSLKRVFAIISLFRVEQRPLRAAEIRRAIDMPTTSTFSILREMVEINYFTFDPVTKTYFPTLELEELCNWVQRTEAGPSKLNSAMASLVAEVGETASINREHYIFTGLTYVRRPQQPFARHFPLAGNIGAPLCQTTSGRVLLSMATEEHLRGVVRNTNRWSKISNAGFSFKVEDILLAARQIRHDGYLCEIDSWMPGEGVISVPVVGKRPELNMAITVSGLSARIRANSARIIKILSTAAQRLQNS